MKSKNNHSLTFFNMMILIMTIIFVIIITVYNVGNLKDYASRDNFRVLSSRDNFRVLLGLTTPDKKSEHFYRITVNLSPAPASAPSPDKNRLGSPPHHHRPARPRPMLPVHTFPVQHKDDKKKKIIILSVIMSSGSVLVVFILGAFLLIKRRFNKQKKVATRTTSVCSDDGDRLKGLSTEGSVFYLNTLSTALESVGNNNLANEVVVRNVLREKALSEEIISAHEFAESCKNDSDDQSISGDKVVDAGDAHSSEDESFDSFCDSRSSSNLRLSNVSIGRFTEPLEIFSPNQSSRSLSSPRNVASSPSPPPPPPPPPPPVLHSSSSTLKVKGIPPPPCLLDNNGGSVRGPPAPPGGPSTILSMGKDGNPLPKLKPLHWDKVRATPDRSMVWDQLRCNSFELDEETIESLFGYSLKTAFTNDEGKSKTPSPASKHVLEPKRLQNITILSKALHVTPEKVCEALIRGEGLCAQQLEALVKMEPTKEEQAKLSNYEGEIDELGSAEKLVKVLLKIPHAFERVEAMLFKATFDDEVVHLRNSFSVLQEACSELRSIRLFLKLLEAVLKTGNRMNIGTIRGGAKAFKLDALLKLSDVKGADGKTTLLHFVVQEIIRSEGIRMSESIMGQIDRTKKPVTTVEEKEDDYRRMGLDLVSGLSTELHNVKRTASVDLDVLATSVSNLSDGMSKVQQLVNKDLDDFGRVMKTFLGHAEKQLRELQSAENMVMLSVREITEYYHGDVSKEEVNPLRIFVVVRDFLGMLDQVCRELKSLKTPRSPNPLNPFS